MRIILEEVVGSSMVIFINGLILRTSRYDKGDL